MQTPEVKLTKASTILTPVLLGLLVSAEASSVCDPDVAYTKPDSIYADHGDGKVTDEETGLMWMKCAVGQSGADCSGGSAISVNWKQALGAAQAANEANGGEGVSGYRDWRLPNKKELASLVERACLIPSINSNLFPAAVSAHHWSSSPFAYSSAYAWVIIFGYGDATHMQKSDEYHVRLVRGGQ